MNFDVDNLDDDAIWHRKLFNIKRAMEISVDTHLGGRRPAFRRAAEIVDHLLKAGQARRQARFRKFTHNYFLFLTRVCKTRRDTPDPKGAPID